LVGCVTVCAIERALGVVLGGGTGRSSGVEPGIDEYTVEHGQSWWAWSFSAIATRESDNIFPAFYEFPHPRWMKQTMSTMIDHDLPWSTMVYHADKIIFDIACMTRI
jgi:hypothetical protein